ncbi:MAG: ribonuclease HII [Nitrospirota bacterium]
MPREGALPRNVRVTGRVELSSGACDLLFFERSAREAGALRVAGLDEAGRGPLAGPVVAAAVVFPEGLLIPGVTDSKQVAEGRRERLYTEITAAAVAYGIGIVDERTIDEVNILEASIIAMERALECISPPPDHLLIDGNFTIPRISIPQRPIVKGDCLSHSIAAASILAKVTRDRLMRDLHERYPQYNFQKHKGYGTKEHMELIRLYGPCDAHRKSFQPVAGMLQERQR